MPRTGHHRTDHRPAKRPPHHLDVDELEETHYRLEYEGTRHVRRFTAPTDEEALKQVAEYLHIPYPIQVIDFTLRRARAVYREGVVTPIFSVGPASH